MRLAALVVIVLCAACSGGTRTESAVPLGPTETPRVFLRNATAAALVYVAAGEGTLALLDIRPRLEEGEYETRLVAPGATVPVTDIIGYAPELGVTFYIYRVDSVSGAAEFVGFFVATADELARYDGVATVTASRI